MKECSDEDMDRDIAMLFQAGLTFPEERIEYLQQRLHREITADEERLAWKAFGAAMGNLRNRWQPLQQFTTISAWYRYSHA